MFAAVAVTALLTAGGCGSAGAATAEPPAGTASTRSLTVQMQNALLALGRQGRGAYADTWGAFSIDLPNNRIILYATDPNRAGAMVDAAHRDSPDTAGVAVAIERCAFTSRDEHAAVDRVLEAGRKTPYPYPVDQAVPTLDGSGIVVYVPAAGVASTDLFQRLQTVASPVAITVRADSQSPSSAP